MWHLLGLDKYLEENYNLSVFGRALNSQESWDIYLHNHLIVTTKIVENRRYEIEIEGNNTVDRIQHKTNVKFLYPASLADTVRPLIKMDKKVKDMGLEPLISPRNRYHIKNKSLFPLMHERKALFFISLEGEIIKGIIADFSRYDITVQLKGGIPVTILRHAVYDLRDKKGRIFLKSFQETHRDWEKSSLYVSSPPENPDN